jgi:pSer/pThr/pTyr-binding forkhead associated (FHA) protein
MRLRYTKQDGTQMEFQLAEQPITIGRSADADIVLLDERVSRIHCGVRLWDGDFYIKDLKSRNGTWVNNEKVDVAKLKAGDAIRVGSTTFSFEQDPAVGTDTAIHEIEGKMDLGKGYTTILREIVDDSESPRRPSAAVVPAVVSAEPPRIPLMESEPEAEAPMGGAPRRRPITIKIKRKE